MNKQDVAWVTDQLDKIRKGTVSYWGITLKKLPLDLWIYQEIIAERKPEVIVEVGNWKGGSTLFLAHLLDVIGRGEVIACDINHVPFVADHPRISKVTGHIGNKDTVDTVEGLVNGRECMVIHDAEHPRDPVLRDLKTLSPLVTVGQYFVVEDGVIDAAGWKPGRPGPLVAIQEFLKGTDCFVADRSRERYGITWNPNGYLERVK